MSLEGFDPSKIPLAAPPPGVTSDLVNGQSSFPLLRHSILATLPLALLFLALRIYTRLRVSRSFAADDYFSVFAGISVIAFCALNFVYMSDDRRGRHLWDIPLSAVSPAMIQEAMASAVVWAFSVLMVKISLFLFYRRVFFPVASAQYMIWPSLIFTVISYVGLMTAYLVNCVARPEDGGWVSASLNARCTEGDLRVNLASSCISVFTDFILLFIPLRLVMQLRLSAKKKVGIAGIFLTGGIAIVLSIVGLAYRVQQFQSTNPDTTYTSSIGQSVGVAECNLGLLCSCMPVVCVLFKSLVTASETRWASLMGYLRSRSKRSQGDLESTPEYAETSASRLPKVPRGHLTGLMTFIRGNNRTKWDETRATNIKGSEVELSPYSELQSVDYDYHVQLDSIARASTKDGSKVGEGYWERNTRESSRRK